MQPSDLATIKEQISLLQKEFEDKIESLQAQITKIEKQYQIEAQPQEKPQSTNSERAEVTPTDVDLEIDIDLNINESLLDSPQETTSSGQCEELSTPQIPETSYQNKDNQHHKTKRNATTLKTGEHDEQVEIKLPAANLMEAISNHGPLQMLAGLSEQIISTYQHFHRQGKANIFFLTLGGMIAFIGGFGYFLQYAFYNLFSNQIKCGLGFATAGIFILIGYRLLHASARKPTASWHEYAAALIGLGLCINTLTLYYVGPYFEWLSTLQTLAALAANALLGYLIAIKFETKIIATVSLLGGLVTPIVFGLAQLPLFSAVAYVFFIAIGSITVARKIQWPPLPYLSLVLSIAFLETHFFSNRFQLTDLNIVALTTILMIIILFNSFLNISLQSLKNRLTNIQATIISSNLVFSLGYLWQIIASETICFITFLALASTGLYFVKARKTNPAQRSLVFTVMGIILATAFLRVLEGEALALIWILEANLLLYLGLKQRLIGVRIEGYILYLIGISQATFLFLQSFDAARYSVFEAYNSPSWGATWWSLFGISIGFATSGSLSRRYHSYLHDREINLTRYFAEANSITITLLTFVTASLLTPTWIWNWAPIPLMVLLYRARYQRLPLSEILAWLMFFPLFGLTIKSGMILGDFYFSTQPWISRVARLELFVMLYVIYYFYYATHFFSGLRALSFNSAELFFIILPIGFLPSVWRHLPEYFATFLWLSTTLACIISWLRSPNYYRLYTICMAGLSALLSLTYLVAYFAGKDLPNTLLMVTFITFFLCAIFLEHHYCIKQQIYTDKTEILTSMRKTAIIFFPFCLSLFIIFNKESLLAGFLSIQIAYTIGWQLFAKHWTQRDMLAFHYSMILTSQALIFITGMLTSSLEYEIMLILISLLLSGTIFYRNSVANRLFRLRKSKLLNISTWTHNYFQIIISLSLYFITHKITSDIEPIYFSVILIIQAVGMLFLSLKKHLSSLQKLSNYYFLAIAVKLLFFDLHGSGLTERIIALMTLGLILLGAAYLLQAAKSRQLKKA